MEKDFACRDMNNNEFGPAVETRLMSEACLSGSALHKPSCNIIAHWSAPEVAFGSIWDWKYILQFKLSSLASTVDLLHRALRT